MPNKTTIFAKSGGAISFADGKIPPDVAENVLALVEGELSFGPKEEGFVKFPNKRPGQAFVITSVTPEVDGVQIIYLQESNEAAEDADIVN